MARSVLFKSTISIETITVNLGWKRFQVKFERKEHLGHWLWQEIILRRVAPKSVE